MKILYNRLEKIYGVSQLIYIYIRHIEINLFKKVDLKNEYNMKTHREARDKKKALKYYQWKSSIPQRWVDIKGDNYFEHVHKSNQPYTTLQFLKETQKYIHYICTGDRRIKSPYKEILPNYRALSHSQSHSEYVQDKPSPPQSATENSKNFPRRSSRQTANLPQRSTSPTSYIRPSYLKISRCNSHATLVSDPPQDLNSSPYAIHKFAIPNGVSSFPKLKTSASECQLNNQELNNFLHRFDKKKVDFTPVKISRGFSGYKLTHPKGMSRSYENKLRIKGSVSS